MTVLPLLLLLIQATTQPSDSTLDWLISKKVANPTTIPTTQATTQPLVDKSQAEGEFPGTIKLSSGKSLTGTISTTPGKPIRVWNEEESHYEDISLDQIQKIEAIIVWERDEKEWRFKESGSDIKVFTGKTYPARETKFKITTIDGQVRTGGVVAPIYLQSEGKITQYILHKRDKGAVGSKLPDLVYVTEIQINHVP